MPGGGSGEGGGGEEDQEETVRRGSVETWKHSSCTARYWGVQDL